MKGGKGGRKRPASAPVEAPKGKRGPSRGESKKDWGATERELPLPPPPVEPRRSV